MRAFVFVAFAGTLALACTSDDPPSTPVVIKNCAKYCEDIRTVCRNENGDAANAVSNAQYSTSDNDQTCLTMCGAMDNGTVGDQVSDTFRCRERYLSEAKEPTDAANLRTLCYNAGAFSEACGNTAKRCATFCKMNVRICQGTNSQYGGSESECVKACGAFAKNGFDNGRLIEASKSDSFLCRAYHLTAASGSSATDRNVHCPHSGASTSPACNDAP
jgi:hypothetical protein